MDLRCTTDKYDTLYARWTATPGTLLDTSRGCVSWTFVGALGRSVGKSCDAGASPKTSCWST
jgi:hypothetical protein